jgi:Family of unknown function (DUF6535)
MVWVIALWLISLVLSLTCALIATLLQQWARRYTETPKYDPLPRHRARVRWLLLKGTKLYKVRLIVEILPTLLHLSVYLFLGGLVITFHPINKTVAIAVDAAVGVSGLAYITLSIVPCFDVKCPYRTPISKILWYPCHALLSFSALCLHSCMLGLRKLLNRPVRRPGERDSPDALARWQKSRGFSIKNHWRFLTEGLEKSIVYRAVETLKIGDRERFTWLFDQLVLGDKDKFFKFAASIPRHQIPDLIPSIESVPFRESLLVLLRSCVANRYSTALPYGGDVHGEPLLVCLHAIRHIVKSSAPTTVPDLTFMRAHFANTGIMPSLWGDVDDSIRITSRSICALVARKVVRKQRLKGAVLSWLQDVTGESLNSILGANVTMLDQMNFKSFVIGALLPNYVPPQHLHAGGFSTKLSTEDAASFNETLASLLGVITDDHKYFTTPDWESRLSEEVGRIQRYDRQGAFEIFDKLRSVFPSLPPVTSAHAVVPPSHLIPPPSPILPPRREASPPRVVFLPRAPPSPRPVIPRAPPSPHPVFPRAPPSPRPVPLRADPPPHAVRPSHRAHRHHAPI